MPKDIKSKTVVGICLIALATLLLGVWISAPQATGLMTVSLANDDPVGNNVKVIDRNAGDALVFEGFIAGHDTKEIRCLQNDSGYGNIATSEDGKPWIRRSFLKPGDRIRL